MYGAVDIEYAAGGRLAQLMSSRAPPVSNAGCVDFQVGDACAGFCARSRRGPAGTVKTIASFAQLGPALSGERPRAPVPSAICLSSPGFAGTSDRLLSHS